MLNVYYDVLIKESGSDPAVYTMSWDVFCLQLQHSLCFLILAFVFLTPEVSVRCRAHDHTRA